MTPGQDPAQKQAAKTELEVDAADAEMGVDCAWARKTAVAHLPGLLSLDEIAELHRVAAQVQSEAASEYRGGADAGRAWRVIYLQTDGEFGRLLPALHAKLRRAAVEADSKESWGLLPPLRHDEWAVRCVEYHRMGRSGGLPDRGHYDCGSLVTIDVMLTRPGVDHEGGLFCTREADGTDIAHPFEQGDALAFVSHKPHCVSPLVRGTRQVLVVEFWRGEARTCPHRCSLPGPGACDLTLRNVARRHETELEDALFSVMDLPLLEAAMAALKSESDS
ncbi:hypothetical protein T492DRAFT_1107787 [Pavlovales sp. CCMP2436]|nr:hypothetical protein T492DRAFT_1107787 [Pavlovales sp. CCMP2436]